jgi:hypothetical protein
MSNMATGGTVPPRRHISKVWGLSGRKPTRDFALPTIDLFQLIVKPTVLQTREEE